jgi:hypothetical protein
MSMTPVELGYYKRIMPFTKTEDIESIPVHNCLFYDSIFERIDAGEQILRGRTKRFLKYLCFYWQDPDSKEEGIVFLFHTRQQDGELNWSGWLDNIVQETTKYYHNEDEFRMDFFRNPNIIVDRRIRP